MNNHQLSLLDLTKEEDFLRTIPHHLFTKVYQTGLIGRGLLHTGYLAGEHQEHSYQQHSIIIYLKPEQNSYRRIGNRTKQENIKVGDVAIVPTQVNYWQKIETKVAENIIIAIAPQVISGIAQETGVADIELLPTFAKSDPLIQHLAFNLKANLDSRNYDRLYAESVFNLLSMHILRNYTTKQFLPKNYNDGLAPYKLRQAKEYISNNIDSPIKLEDIATLLNINQFYFCHLFKKSTGISPYKYVIQQRIAKAKNLIERSKLTLAEVAYECGFSSQSQMTKHFRKCVGVTPKIYRNMLCQ